MHVAQITPYYYPTTRWLGPVSCVHEISRYLLEQGHQVSIITSFPNELSNPHVPLPNVRIHRFYRLRGVQSYFFSPFLLFHFLKNQHYDIIHVHNYRNFFADVGALIAKMRKIPLILTPHGTLERNVALRRGFPSAQKIFNIYDNVTSFFAAKTAQWILFSSTNEKNSSYTFGTDNTVIPFGIDVQRFMKSSGNNIFRKKLSIEDDEVVLLSVGRISVEKNTLLLLKALKMLKDKGYDKVKLVLVGEAVSAVGGVTNSDYMMMIRDFAHRYDLMKDVRFVGGIYDNDLIDAYLSSDVFLCVSLAENFCLPILEAAASCLPIITSIVGIAPDFVEDMKSGILLESYDPVTLTEKISYLIDNASIAKEIGKQALSRVKSTYSWKKTGQDVERIYFKAVKNNYSEKIQKK